MTDSSVDMLVKPIPKSRRSKNPDEEWIELSQTPTVELQRSATINVTSDSYVDGMREGGDQPKLDGIPEAPDQNRTLSFDESTLSSKSSRSDLKSLATQRIRQQMKSLAEKKRGSIHQIKRPNHNTLLISPAEPSENSEEYLPSDEQIAGSIELGAKYVETGVEALPSEFVPRDIFLGTVSDPNQKHPVNLYGNIIIYSQPQTLQLHKNFKARLIFYSPNSIVNHVEEDPYSLRKTKMFSVKSLRNFSILSQRCGIRFNEESGVLRGLEELTIIPTLPIRQFMSEEIPRYLYCKADVWQNWRDSNIRRTIKNIEYSHLDLNISRIDFEHHWLFSAEDSSIQSARFLNEENIKLNAKVLKLVHKYLDLKQTLSANEYAIEEKSRIAEEMQDLLQRISDGKGKAANFNRQLEQMWSGLQRLCGEHIPFALRRLPTSNETALSEIEENLFEDVPQEIRDYFHSPIIILNEIQTAETPTKLNKARFEAVSKVVYQIQIFFNEIFVSSTEQIALRAPSFSVCFSRVYSLKVFDQPKKLTLCLRERFKKGPWQQVAQLNLPLDEQPTDDDASDPSELKCLYFESDIVRESLSSGSSNKLRGRLFYSIKWTPMSQYKPPKSEKLRQSSSLLTTYISPEARLLPDEYDDARLLALEQRYRKSRFIHGFHSDTVGNQVKEMGITKYSEKSLSEELLSGKGPLFNAFLKAGECYTAALRKHYFCERNIGWRVKRYSEVIMEEPLPTTSFQSIFGTVFSSKPFQFSRKLKPNRTSFGPSQTYRDQVRPSHRLIVNIQYANNVPTRVSGLPPRTCVQLTFQVVSIMLLISSCPHPTWQETILFDIRKETLDILNTVENIDWAVFDETAIRLDLYDCLISPLYKDNREVDIVYERLEKRWLGTVNVSLSSVCTMGKIDGFLIMTSPLFYTGHKFLQLTSLKIRITIDPPLLCPNLSIPLEMSNFRETDNAIISKCLGFEQRNRRRFPGRRFLSFVLDSSGKQTMICRYIAAMEPPSRIVHLSYQNLRKAAIMASNLISSIPILNAKSALVSCDIVLTVDEVITILLVCWLLGLKISASLLLGTGFPCGFRSAYALVRLEDEISIVDPTSGCWFNQKDPYCPLTSVGVIVTSQNVFANIQPHEHPSQIDYDFKNRSNWNSLFSADKTDLISLQVQHPHYQPINEESLMELRTSLERTIKVQFDQARKHGIPQWNLLASRTLRIALTDYWADLQNDVPLNRSHHYMQSFDVSSNLTHLQESFTVSALAFTTSYSSNEQIIAAVLTTGLHLNSNPSVQFALAVHFEPFFGHTLSCSIALASLTPII